MQRLALVAQLALFTVPLAACDNSAEPTQEEKDAKFARQLKDADARIRNNKPEDAKKILARLLEERPDDPKAVALLGKVHYATANYKEAEGLLRKAIAAKADDAEMHYILGETLRYTDQFADAATSYDQAFQLDPENSTYGLAEGIALLKAGKPVDAEATLKEVVDLDPKALDGANTGVNTFLGDAYRAQGKLDDALRSYMKAQTVSQSDKMAFAGAAFVYEDKKDVKHALDQWSAYIQRDCCSEYSKTVAQKKMTELEIPADE